MKQGTTGATDTAWRASLDTPFETMRRERLAYGLFAFGGIFSYYLVMSYLQKFLTDSGIAAVTVGVIFVISKIWDAVIDPVFGVTVDRVNLRGGKYKPWLRAASIAIPITTVFMFIMPLNISLPGKVLWALAANLLWGTCYTMYDTPTNSSATTMTANTYERNFLFSLTAFFVYLGGIIVAIVVPMLYPTIGWTATGIVMAVLCALNMLWLPLFVKERHATTAQSDLNVRDIVGSLLHNKYLLIFVGTAVVGQSTNFGLTLNVYLAEDVFGGPDWMTLITLASALPVLITALFVPKIIARFEKFWVYIVTVCVSMAMNLIIFLVGFGHPWIVVALIFVRSFFDSFAIVASATFVADCIEYAQFTMGVRAQGIAFSMKSFMNKLIVAITGALAMFGLQIFGYREGAGIVQSATTTNGIWFLCTFMPLVGAALSLIIFHFYRIRSADVKLMILANKGEISHDEAETGLSAALRADVRKAAARASRASKGGVAEARAPKTGAVTTKGPKAEVAVAEKGTTAARQVGVSK